MQELFQVILKNPGQYGFTSMKEAPVFLGKKNIGNGQIRCKEKQVLADIWLTVDTDFSGYYFTLSQEHSFFIIRIVKARKGGYKKTPPENLLSRHRALWLSSFS